MLCMQESTIKSNFAYMRLLCGLLLFSIVDCCLYSCRNLKPCVSLSCRDHSVFCFSGLTVAFSHSSKLFFLPLFKVIPTKLAHFRLIFQNFFSFKTWFINKFQGRDGSLESGDRFQSPCDNITATNLAF